MNLTSDLQDMMGVAREKFIAGEYNSAESILSQILLRNSRVPEVFQMLATIYYDRGQFNKAIKTFRRALEIDPGYTDASVGLSIILNDLGKYEEGKKVFQEAQALLDKKNSRNDPYFNEKLANKHEELADLYFQKQIYSEALENLQKALKLSTRKAEITMRTVECLVKLNNIDDAARELRLLIKEFPKFVPARLRIAVLLYHQNKTSEAIQHWENVLAIDPQNNEATKHLNSVKSSKRDFTL